MNGTVIKVSGPLVVANGLADANVSDVVRVGDQRLIGEILNIQNALNLGMFVKDTSKEPYYTVYGCIDLDKFKLKPIKENEESTLIKPYKDYIVFCGNKFAVANSCQGVDGGYFVYPNVQAFLPLVDYYDAQKIFKKYVEVYKKLDYMKKDFE